MIKSTNPVIKMTWSAHGKISKKNLVAYLHMMNETLSHKFQGSQISSIFHFDRISDSRMAHVLGVKFYVMKKCQNVCSNTE